MKKTALLLVIIMLLGVCTVFSGCNNDTSTSSVEDAISSEVKYALLSKIALQNVSYGTNLIYFSHTIRVSETSKNNYRVNGTATCMSGGIKYTASYSGDVEYNPSTSDYDVAIYVDRFR